MKKIMAEPMLVLMELIKLCQILIAKSIRLIKN
jgi:hypothetical protein